MQLGLVLKTSCKVSRKSSRVCDTFQDCIELQPRISTATAAERTRTLETTVTARGTQPARWTPRRAPTADAISWSKTPASVPRTASKEVCLVICILVISPVPEMMVHMFSWNISNLSHFFHLLCTAKTCFFKVPFSLVAYSHCLH